MTTATIKQLWNDAHTLRQDVGGGKDYLGRHTTGRITYGAAVAKYGREVVHSAMRQGYVYLEIGQWQDGARFDPANATDETLLQANGECIG